MTADNDIFISEFKHWRDVRGLSQLALAERMAYTRSYLSKIEGGRERPSADFAARADEVLQAGGALRRAFHEFERSHDAFVSFSWSTTDPPLHARYRLEWEFRSRVHAEGSAEPVKPSEIMASLGIVQRGDASLEEPARPFVLPEEAEEARRVVAQLQAMAERVGRVHTFVKGVGLAAPQIGIHRAAAIVKPPDGERIVLLNPRIVDQSAETTHFYEGCLSFFDVRGVVPRPLAIEVEHEALDGSKRITHFERGIARLVAHEIDHLNGILYVRRMQPGVLPIPIEEYRGTGQGWAYP